MICKKLEACLDGEMSGKSLKQCDNIRNECIVSSDNRSQVKCEEKKKKYIFENTRRRHVVSYKMDGGVIVTDKNVPENTSKCDYLFAVGDEEKTAILTELKGTDVPKSLEQIKGTLMLYQDFFSKFEHVYGRIVVSSSTPNLKATASYVNLERMLRKKYEGNIKIFERQKREKDIDLDKQN